MVLALSTLDTTIWQVTLAVGLIVIVVVIGLLGLLLNVVGSIETAAAQLLESAHNVGANTGNIKAALTVADTLDLVAQEAGRHAELLGVTAR
jgi:hypothetical protein